LQVKEEWGLFERTSQDSYAYHLAPHIPCNEQQQGGEPAVMYPCVMQSGNSAMHGGLEEEDKLRQLQVVGKVLAKCVVDQQHSSVRIVAALYENPSYTYASSLRPQTLVALAHTHTHRWGSLERCTRSSVADACKSKTSRMSTRSSTSP